MHDSSSHKRLGDLTIDEFLATVAADTPAPGGGSVAALAGALGAALAAMVAGLTVGRERYAAHDAEMRSLLARANALRQELVALMDTDTAAYTAVMAAYKLPKDTEAQRAERTATIQAALRGAAETPLAAATVCAAVLRLTVQAAAHGNRNAASDAAVSALMAHAGLVGAARNVRINLKSIDDEAFCRAAETRVAGAASRGRAGAGRGARGRRRTQGSRVMPRLRGRGAAVAALIGTGLLTLVMTYPLIRRFTSAIPGDGFDGWQNYWNLWWVRQALLVEHTHPWFTDMLYAPVGVSLLFHTLNLFNGLTDSADTACLGVVPGLQLGGALQLCNERARRLLAGAICSQAHAPVAWQPSPPASSSPFRRSTSRICWATCRS